MDTKINQFISFWSDPKKAEVQDPARALARAYRDVEVQLDVNQPRILKYIVPVKGSKVAWTVGFDPNKMDEIALLSQQIEALEQRKESIAHDIIALLDITGGSPELMQLAIQKNRAKGIINRAIVAASAARKGAMHQKQNAEATLEELAALPEIEEAEAKLVVVRSEQESIIKDLEDKLKRCNAIIAQVNEGNLA